VIWKADDMIIGFELLFYILIATENQVSSETFTMYYS